MAPLSNRKTEEYFFRFPESGPGWTLAPYRKNLLKDPSCGKVHRVKGFLLDERGQWLELNATARELTVKPVAVGQDVIIVIGEKLDKEKISSFFENTVVMHNNS